MCFCSSLSPRSSVLRSWPNASAEVMSTVYEVSCWPMSNASPRSGGLHEPPMQPLGARADDVKVAVEMIGVQRRDREASLTAPFLALRDENALHVGFIGVPLELPPATEPLRTFTQDRVDRLGVPHAHHASLREIESEDRAIAPAPLFGRRVQAARTQLVRVAETRQSRRARQVGDRSCGWHRAHSDDVLRSPRRAPYTTTPRPSP